VAPNSGPPDSQTSGTPLLPRVLRRTASMIDRQWARHYQPGVPVDIEIPTEPLTALIERAVADAGPLVAVDFYGQTTTYAELGGQISSAAEGLRLLGVQPGDRVAVILPNCPQHVVAFHAVLRLGAVVVEHSPMLSAPEFEHMFDDHGARVAICWDQSVARLPEPGIDVVRVSINRALGDSSDSDAGLAWDELLATGALSPDHPKPDVADLAAIQYTSGTTGVPLGVMLTHANLFANARQGAAWLHDARPRGEVFDAILPMSHAMGITLFLTMGLLLQARLVVFSSFDPDQVVEAARRVPPTGIFGVPPVFAALAQCARSLGVPLTTARFCISGATRLPDAAADIWENETGGLLVEGYGLTEASPLCLANPFWPNRRRGTVGVPVPSTLMRVVDPDTGADAERGELLVSGPQVFSGYWNNPEATRQALLPGGWLRTGDIVVADADGFVTVVDRAKALMKTRGLSVSPAEVETVLRSHPGVADAVVVGISDSSFNETVSAAVQPKPGVEVLESEILAHCRERLAVFKVPERVLIVPTLPVSELGKALRQAVADLFNNA